MICHSFSTWILTWILPHEAVKLWNLFVNTSVSWKRAHDLCILSTLSTSINRFLSLVLPPLRAFPQCCSFLSCSLLLEHLYSVAHLSCAHSCWSTFTSIARLSRAHFSSSTSRWKKYFPRWKIDPFLSGYFFQPSHSFFFFSGFQGLCDYDIH